MELPKPGEHHQRLERLAGTWTGEERYQPSPMFPGGGTALATVENRMALDGFALVQDYSHAIEGRTSFRGHGVLRWDPAEAHYVFHWFDSGGAHPVEFRGHFEGDRLALEARTAQGHLKASWELTDDGNGYRYEMLVSQDGSLWFPFMASVCRKR
jgi:hypothetical protein